MGGKITLQMEDWLYNSGLIGLYNILSSAGNRVVTRGNCMEFDADDLQGFEEKYFNYLIEKYSDILSINKIISFKEFILDNENSNFENFTEKSLRFLNDEVIDNTKKYLKSNSYKAAYDLIDSSINMLDLEKQLKKVKLSKKSNIKEIISEIKVNFEVLKEIIKFMELEESKKYIGAKNIIYIIIKNAWNGVSFLNPQTKEKDMYDDYKKYFIDPVVDYVDKDKSKYKYNCFACNNKMNDMNGDLSFLNLTGFDVNRKTSHVWNFQNDVAVCPICKLVYSCVPAGITYFYDKGIYVNDNSSVINAAHINNRIYQEIYKKSRDNNRLTYKALVDAINEEFIDKMKYELADIQLIRYEDEKYKFNVLSRKALSIIRESKEDLSKLVNCRFKEGDNYTNIYELVLDRLLNNQNMFTLIQKLLYYKLSQPNDSYYNTYHVLKILNINTRFLRGVGYMNGIYKDIVNEGNKSGIALRERYRKKGAVDKLNGISYRLLNSLKTNNVDSFMDTLLNCHLYANLSVSEIFLDILKSEEKFKSIGYAFVAGLIEEKKENENRGDEVDE